MAAFNFNNIPGFTVMAKKFLAGLFNTSTGHDHDGTNSKAVSGGVTLTGTQTLTNKTLTTPTITGGTATSKEVVTAVTADGAITIATGVVSIGKTSAAAMTLAAPTSAQAGTVITIVSTTAYAHVITFTGSTLLNGTSAAKTTATFAAYAGAGIQVVANNLEWALVSSTAATIA